MNKLTNDLLHHDRPESLNITGIKSKMKASWEDGDYAGFAHYMQAGAIEVLEGWNIAPGTDLLDVACGSGQTAIPAAKQGIKVTGIDIASNLVAYARQRVIDEGLDAFFDEGDAEDLPYPDQIYDTVISMFGAMFAPNPVRVVTEIARVLRPGGQLYMANWTPTSMPAQMFKCVSEVVPPPLGIIPPVLWGDEEVVRDRLSGYFTNIVLTKKIYPNWHYPFSTSELVDLFRTHFGPVKKAFDSLDEQGQQQLSQQLDKIYSSQCEKHRNGITITGGEYLEVIATRSW